MGILYFLMTKFMGTLTEGAPLPNALVFILLTLAFVVLSLITHMQQYRTTYGLVYSEVKAVRISLAERLRKLPLGYFGKRDLADLTETIMGDVNRLEHLILSKGASKAEPGLCWSSPTISATFITDKPLTGNSEACTHI